MLFSGILQGPPGMTGDKGVPGRNSTHQGQNGTKGSRGEEVSETRELKWQAMRCACHVGF